MGTAVSDGFAVVASVRLSIMYNFPGFDLMKGCSRIYDTDSRYYNAFCPGLIVSAVSLDLMTMD